MQFQNVRSFSICVGIEMQYVRLAKLVRTCSTFASMVPHAQLKVYDEGWDLWLRSVDQTSIDPAEAQWNVNEFRKYGKRLEKKFSSDDIMQIPRTWKLYPVIENDSVKSAKQKLLDAGVKKAKQWIDDGL